WYCASADLKAPSACCFLASTSGISKIAKVSPFFTRSPLETNIFSTVPGTLVTTEICVRSIFPIKAGSIFLSEQAAKTTRIAKNKLFLIFIFAINFIQQLPGGQQKFYCRCPLIENLIVII